MTKERWKLVEEIFHGAADLTGEEQAVFLKSACADEEILEQVKSLLRYDRAEIAPIGSVVGQAAAALREDMQRDEPLIGIRLGPYRIQEELGRGGMGAVYLATRDDRTFEKKVAVKVVKRGMDSDAVLGRFHHERQILANLEHPHIARLLDAGTVPDGRPYFVLEYVEGEPIVAYAKRRELGLEALLELFRKVCDAVAYAHRNLVVHRDLKAGNILVSGDGAPKLLDFGIAKLVGPESLTQDTGPAARMLTLECASPEQVRGDAVTTATDIYSLGLLLFELLAGRPAWDFRAMSRVEAEEVVRYGTAPKPSVAGRNARLAGDLDNIVAMALRKDPARRYRSVDEFSEDLRRYAVGLPVIAREDSFAYRSSKFLRRNWGAVGLGTVAVLGLTIGIIYANYERRRAEVRLSQMLGMANQTLLNLQTEISHEPGSTETRLRIMQSTLGYLAGAAKESGTNQQFRTTLAKAYLQTGDVQGFPGQANLGDTAGALESYASAERLVGRDDTVMRAELLWHRGEMLTKLGRLPEGLKDLRASVAEAAKSDTNHALQVAAGAYHSLAFTLTLTNADEAIENARHETEIYSKLLAREPENKDFLDGLASSYSTMGGGLNRKNKMEEAVAIFRKGLAIRERILAKDPNDVGLRRDLMISYGRVGDTLGNPAMRNLGDKRGALEVYRKAQAIAESLVAADPKNSRARMDLGEILWRVGTTMDAPEEARESLEILAKAREAAMSASKGKELNVSQNRALATIAEYRGRRLSALGDDSGAVASIEESLRDARANVQKAPNDASSWSQTMWDYDALTATLAKMGRGGEAVRYGEMAVAESRRLAAEGPDPERMALFVPKACAWLGAAHEILAAQEKRPERRRVEFGRAAEAWGWASEEWQKLHGREDIFRYRREIAECGQKVLECNRRAKTGI